MQYGWPLFSGPFIQRLLKNLEHCLDMVNGKYQIKDFVLNNPLEHIRCSESRREDNPDVFVFGFICVSEVLPVSYVSLTIPYKKYYPLVGFLASVSSEIVVDLYLDFWNMIQASYAFDLYQYIDIINAKIASIVPARTFPCMAFA